LRELNLQRITSGGEAAVYCAVDFLYVDLSRRERDERVAGRTRRQNASGDTGIHTANFRRVTELR